MHTDVQPRVLHGPYFLLPWHGYSFDMDGKSKATYVFFKCLARGNFSVQDDLKENEK